MNRKAAWGVSWVLLSSCAVESSGDSSEEELGTAIQAISVADVLDSSCTTESVRGLSQQIIDAAKCFEPDAYQEVPEVGGVSFGAPVFPYLEAPARDALVAALMSRPDQTMSVNSMLRTVAQQFLLYEWYQSGRCGIGLAAVPGNSNHESGLALDISEYATWRDTLEANGFQWFGSNDAVHFDYVGPGAVSYQGVDVLAFQKLWNVNNPGDLLVEDGLYGSNTRARMMLAPAEGFPQGLTCDEPSDAPNLGLAISLPGLTDSRGDGLSAGVADAVAEVGGSVLISIENTGAVAAQNVELGFEVDEAFLAGQGYTLERSSGGDFSVDPLWGSPSNPPTEGADFAVATFALGPFEPGEVKHLEVPLALTYSIVSSGAPWARVWIRTVDDRYHQESFGGEIVSDGSQTFGKGRLELETSLDIYSDRQWEWETSRLEGATGPEGIVLSTIDGALVVPPLATGQEIWLPSLVLPSTEGTLEVQASGAVASFSVLLEGADGAISERPMSGDEATEVFALPFGSQRIGFRATTDSAALNLQSVRLDDEIAEPGGGGGAGAGGGGVGGGGPDDSDDLDSGGCSCRVGEGPHDGADPRSTGALAFVLLSVGTAVRGRRRRRA